MMGGMAYYECFKATSVWLKEIKAEVLGESSDD
jgi:hypothetical protein